ncbi:MAG: hypothetical protein PVH12_07435 [Candidatus Bathyarchaeota archaeon]|jgi:hypothetical protein
MNKTRFLLYFLFVLNVFTCPVYAEDESFAANFLGSPLLILVAIILIDVIFFFINKIRS